MLEKTAWCAWIKKITLIAFLIKLSSFDKAAGRNRRDSCGCGRSEGPAGTSTAVCSFSVSSTPCSHAHCLMSALAPRTRIVTSLQTIYSKQHHHYMNVSAWTSNESSLRRCHVCSRVFATMPALKLHISEHLWIVNRLHPPHTSFIFHLLFSSLLNNYILCTNLNYLYRAFSYYSLILAPWVCYMHYTTIPSSRLEIRVRQTSFSRLCISFSVSNSIYKLRTRL